MDIYFLFGVLTGLLPSLHPNNLVNLVNSKELIPIAILHSFINIIPLILFLVPDVYAISSLNASNLLYKKGLSLEAIIVSSLASLTGALISFLFYLIPEIFYLLKNLKALVILILISLVIYLIFYNSNIFQIISRILLVLSASLLIAISENKIDPYLLLTGFFGLSSIYLSGAKIKQEIGLNLIYKVFRASYLLNILKYSSIAVLLAVPANIYPLLTPTHFLLVLLIFLRINLIESIILVSAMSSSDFILSVITKDFFNYSRNYVISEAALIPYQEIIFYLFFSFIILLFLAFLVVFIHNKISGKAIKIFVIFSVIIPLIILGTFSAIIFVIIATLLGIISLKSNNPRINLFSGYIVNYIFHLLENKYSFLKNLRDFIRI